MKAFPIHILVYFGSHGIASGFPYLPHSPIQVEFEEEDVRARLSWERKEVEVPGNSAEVLYSVLVSSEGTTKQDSKEVYRSALGPLHVCGQ